MANVQVLQYLYPEDPTGAAASNKVIGEKQTLNPPTEPLDFHWIIPKATPYFRDTMQLRHVPTGRTLVMGMDWAPGHKFISASYELQGIKGGVYASILFFDPALSGQVEFVEYQTLGGNWTLNETKILELLDAKSVDPRQVSYEEVNGKPSVFPPIEHNHPADDLTGMVELIKANYDISAAIREQTQTWLENPPVLPDDHVDEKIDIVYQTMNMYYLKKDEAANTYIQRQFLTDNYYDKSAINSKFGNYYDKATVDSKVSAVQTSVNNLGNALYSLINTLEVDAVAVTNYPLSDLPVIDGKATTTGMLVLAAGQSDSRQNGVYAVQAGAWVRSALALKEDLLVKVKYGGQLYGSTKWRLMTKGAIVPGTTSLTFKRIGNMGDRDLFVSAAAPDPSVGIAGDVYFQI